MQEAGISSPAETAGTQRASPAPARSASIAPVHGEPMLRATWVAVLGAIYALLMLSPAVVVASPLERAVFAPAAWALELLAERRHVLYPGLFPLVAALQLLALGLLVDARRILRGLRRGRPGLAPAGDPLWPWKATAFLALVAVACTYFANRHAEEPYFRLDPELATQGVVERRELLAARLEEARQSERDARRVVLVGDSMMGAALVELRGLEAGLERGGGRRVETVFLVTGGLELVELRPFVDELLALEPALVVLDANFLFTKVGNLFLLRHYGRAARWANGALDRLEEAGRALGLAPARSAQYAPGDVHANLAPAAPLAAGARDRWIGRRASAHDPNYVFAAELLETLARHRVPVCITTVPVSDALRPHVEGYVEEARALVRELASRHDVPFLESEPFAPDDWYVDTVHMNDAGRPKYGAWFVRHVPAIR